jgi:hypothetical protein
VDGQVSTEATGERPGRSWLACVWPRPAGRDLAVASRARAQRMLSASWLIVMLAVLAMGVTVLSAGIGYGLAQQSDERLWAEQRASLRNAISEFRTLFGPSQEIDPRFVRMVEQTTGLQGLKFETDPAPSEREMQPVMDAHGRIAGFFTWDRAHPMTRAMNRLLPVIFGVAAVLVGFGGFRCGSSRAPGATSRRASSRWRAPPTSTSSPGCPITPRRSNCSTSLWPNALATK